MLTGFTKKVTYPKVLFLYEVYPPCFQVFHLLFVAPCLQVWHLLLTCQGWGNEMPLEIVLQKHVLMQNMFEFKIQNLFFW